VKKNLKRVTAAKAIAEKRWQAQEQQKKKLSEADSIIAKEQLRKAEESARKAQEAVKAPPLEFPAEKTTPAAEPKTEDALTTTQWLSVISIIISMVGIYYKREEIKRVFAKIKVPTVKAPTVKAPTVKAPTVEAPTVKTSIERSGIRSMD